MSARCKTWKTYLKTLKDGLTTGYDDVELYTISDKADIEHIQDVEDIPEDAARWASEKAQDVEDVGRDAEDDFGGVEGAYDRGCDERQGYGGV